MASIVRTQIDQGGPNDAGISGKVRVSFPGIFPAVRLRSWLRVKLRGLGITPKKLRGIVPRRTYVLQRRVDHQQSADGVSRAWIARLDGDRFRPR